jgi:16S rRNA (cytidine1402-2'-O)-methyltransferase
VARELTKEHEELVRGTLADLAARYRDERPLGEVTLVVAGAGEDGGGDEAGGGGDEDLSTRADALLARGLSARDAADALAAETGRPRRALYALVVARQQGRPLGGDED